MKKKHRQTSFIVHLAFWVGMMYLIGACVPRQPQIVVVPLKTNTPGPDRITSPTLLSTVAPTFTPPPTLTPTLVPSATATQYMGFDFSQVEIKIGGFLSQNRYFIAFQFPWAVEGEYHAIVNGNKPYACDVRPDFPDRLYCHGPLVAANKWASVDLFGDDLEVPVFHGEFFVPLQ